MVYFIKILTLISFKTDDNEITTVNIKTTVELDKKK